MSMSARVPSIHANVTSPSRSSLENPEYKYARSAAVPASIAAFTGTANYATIATMSSDAASTVVHIIARLRVRTHAISDSPAQTSSRHTSKYR